MTGPLSLSGWRFAARLLCAILFLGGLALAVVPLFAHDLAHPDLMTGMGLFLLFIGGAGFVLMILIQRLLNQ